MRNDRFGIQSFMIGWYNELRCKSEQSFKLDEEQVARMRKRLRRIRTLGLSIFLGGAMMVGSALLPTAALAIDSNGTGGGNWGTGTSWTGGTSPAGADAAVIISGDNISIVADESEAAASLTINNGTLNQYGGGTAGGTLAVSGAIIVGDGTNTSSIALYANTDDTKSANLSGGSLQINANGTVTANGGTGYGSTLNLAGNTITLNGGTLSIADNDVNFSFGDFVFTGGTLSTALNVDLSGAASDFTAVSGGTLSGSGTKTIDTVTNTDYITLNGGTLNVAGAFDGTNFTFTSGTLDANGTFDSTKPMGLSSGKTLQVGSANFVTSAATQMGYLSVTGGSLSISGTLNSGADSATLNDLNGGLAGFTAGSITVSGEAELGTTKTIASGMSLSVGSFTDPNNATLDGGTISVTGAGGFDVNTLSGGTAGFVNGTLNVSNAATAGAAITIGSGQTVNVGSLTDPDNVTLSGGSLTVNGNFDATGGTQAFVGNYDSGNLTVQGTFTAGANLTVDADMNVNIDAAGDADNLLLQGGTLYVDGNFTTTATFNGNYNSGDLTVRNTGGTAILDVGSALTIDDDMTVKTDVISNENNMSISGGSVTVYNDNVTGSGITMNGGSLTVYGDVDATGMIWTDPGGGDKGTLTLYGTLATDSYTGSTGQTLNLYDSSTTVGAYQTSGTAAIGGTVNVGNGVTLTATGAGFDATGVTINSGAVLTFTGAGSITNLATNNGTVNITNAGGDWTTDLANPGTVVLTNGASLIMTNTGDLYTNNVTVTNGTLDILGKITDSDFSPSANATLILRGTTGQWTTNDTSIGAGTVQMEGGTLVANGAFNTTGAGTFTFNSGTLDVGGALTGIASAGANQDIILNGGSATWTTTAAAITGTVTLKDGGSLTASNAGFDATNLSVSGTGGALDFSGAGALTGLGAGDATLDLAISNAGGTWAPGQDVELNALDNSGTIDIDGNTLTLNASSTLGTINDTATGGTLDFNGGTSTTAGGLADTISVDVASGAVFQATADETIAGLVNAGTVTVDNTMTLTVNNATGGALGVVNGPGTLALGGGGTFTTDGSFADTLNASVATGTTLQLTADDTVNTLAGVGTIDLNGNNLIIAADSTVGNTFNDSNPGTPPSAVVFNGTTLTLSAADFNPGAVLQVGDSDTITTTGAAKSWIETLNVDGQNVTLTGTKPLMIGQMDLDNSAATTLTLGTNVTMTGDSTAPDEITGVDSLDNIVIQDNATIVFSGAIAGGSGSGLAIDGVDGGESMTIGGLLTTLQPPVSGDVDMDAVETAALSAISSAEAGNIEEAASTMYDLGAANGGYDPLYIGTNAQIDDVAVTEPLAIGATTIGANSKLTVQGDYNYVEGAMTIDDTAGELVIDGGLLYNVGGIGSETAAGTGTLTIANGGTLYFASGSSFDATKMPTFQISGGTSSARNVLKGYDATTPGANFDIDGTDNGGDDFLSITSLDMETNQLRLNSGDAANNEVLDVTIGTLTNAGTIALGADTVLSIDNGTVAAADLGLANSTSTINLGSGATLTGDLTTVGLLGLNDATTATGTTTLAAARGLNAYGGDLTLALDSGTGIFTPSGTGTGLTGTIDASANIAGGGTVVLNSTDSGKITLDALDVTSIVATGTQTVSATSGNSKITTFGTLTTDADSVLTIAGGTSKIQLNAWTYTDAAADQITGTGTVVLNFAEDLNIDTEINAGVTTAYGALWYAGASNPDLADVTFDTSGQGTVTLDAPTLGGGGGTTIEGGGTVNAGAASIGGTINTGSGTTLNLSGATGTGNTTLSGMGTVQVGSGGLDLGGNSLNVGGGAAGSLNIGLGSGSTITNLSGLNVQGGGAGSVAILQGTGTIGGPVIGGGFGEFRPGNSTGSITATSFMFTATDKVFIELAQGSNDTLNASAGNITFGGDDTAAPATTIVISSYGDFTSTGNKTYTIMNVTGGTFRDNGAADIADGEIGTVVDSSIADGTIIDTVQGGTAGVAGDYTDGYKFELAGGETKLELVSSKVDQTSGIMQVTVNVLSTGSGGSNPWTPNENAAYDAAQTLANAGKSQGTAIMTVMSGLSGAAKEDAANQLTTMATTSGAMASLHTSAEFAKVTSGRIGTFREAFALRDSGSDADWALASNDAELMYLGQCHSLQETQVWFKSFGNWINQDAITTPGLRGYDVNTFGFSIGADRLLDDNVLVGVTAGGAWNQINVNDTGNSNGSTDSCLVDLYGSWFNWYGLYVDGSVGYQHSSYSFDRVAPAFGETAHSKFGGDLFRTSWEFGEEFKTQSLSVTPYYGMEYISMRQDGYTETGAPNIAQTVDANTTTAWLQTVGARVSKQFCTDNGWIVEPEFDAAWVHDYGDGDITTVGYYAFDTARSQAIVGVGYPSHRNRARLGAGVDVAFSQRLDGFFDYSAELAHGFSSHTVLGGMSVKF